VAPLRNYINGRFVASKSGRTRPYLNPADNSVLGTASDSDAEDVEEAVNAARESFDRGPWPWTPAAERAGKLFKLADLVESIGRELGTYGYDAYTEVKQIYTNVAPGRLGWFKSV
jgi:betaine-aldehyde dehydrogenase